MRDLGRLVSCELPNYHIYDKPIIDGVGSMENSTFLAQLMGPVFIVMGAGMLISPRDYRMTAEEFLRSRALIYIAGLMALVPGLAIVLAHNVWEFDWRLIITLLGWLGVIGGVFRLLLPRQVTAIGSAMLAHPEWLRIPGAGVVALGVILVYFVFVT